MSATQEPKRFRYRCEIEPKCKGDERCARLPCPCGFWQAWKAINPQPGDEPKENQ